MIFKNNKATSTDIIVFLVVAFLFSITFLIAVPVFDTLRDDINQSLGTEGRAVLAQYEHSLNMADTVFMIMWFVLALGGLVSAFFVKTNPIYFGLTLLFFVPMLILGPVFSNMYESVSDNSFFTPAVSRMPQMDAFMNDIHLFNIVYAFLLVIVLYVSFRSGD